MLAMNKIQLASDKLRMNISDLKLEWKDKSILIVGSGLSGISCADFLTHNKIDFTIIDSRTSATNIADINQNYQIIYGEFEESYFNAADILIVSPGVSIQHPYIQSAIEQEKEILGDVDLFCRLTDAPIIAITGSNGKSTVTTLVNDILNAANINSKMGGNIGVPCLDLLSQAEAECYVLELSSFQLETTSHLTAIASVILNLSEDHMDRYASYADYCNAKTQIFKNSKNIIVNLDDDFVAELSETSLKAENATSITFGINSIKKPDFYIEKKDGVEWVFNNNKAIVNLSKIKIVGQHNKLNILAALSLCSVLDLDLEAATSMVLNDFVGLEHRSQLVSTDDGVQWINDSKATNVGATSAALKGFADKPVHLILGGQAKGQDFSELLPLLTNNLKSITIYGEDVGIISQEIIGNTNISVQSVETLEQAIKIIQALAIKADVVLFSPACASFDQFDNYMHRGQTFIEYIKGASCL